MAEDNGQNRPERSSRPNKPAYSSRTSRPGADKPRSGKPASGGARSGAPTKRTPSDGERREYKPRDGERRDRAPRDGERREWKPRDGEKRDYKPRDGERREYKPRDRDNHRERGPRVGDQPRSYGRGGTRGDGRSDRGGVDREFTEAERIAHELRPVRSAHRDPEIPETVTAKDLNPGARNELKTLDKDLADTVARHLAMVNILLETEPELAHQHAISASRKAGRIPVTRETLAITSYVLGDYAGALRELRTYRRLSGSENQLPMMLDCERGLNRPEKALELGRSVDRDKLPIDVQVQVAIAMSGARLDLGQVQQALFELEIPQLDPNKAFSWSPELFAAYATVLEDLGRDAEAKDWRARALQAEAALDAEFGEDDMVDVLEIVEVEPEDELEEEAPPVAEELPVESEREAELEPEEEHPVQAESTPE